MKLSEFAEKSQNSMDIEKDLTKQYDEMKNLSHDELLSRLREDIKRQKANGSFNYDAMLNSLNQIRAYLPNGVYENMIRIIDEINGKD